MNSQWTGRVILRLMLERKFLVAGTTLALLFCAVVMTFLLPRNYESATRVRVLGNQALRSLHGHQIQTRGDAPGVDQLICQGFRSRAAAEYVVTTLGLDQPAESRSEAEQGRFREELLQSIQSSVQVDLLQNGPVESTFRIACKSRDPASAQRIVTRLATGSHVWLQPDEPPTDDLDLQQARTRAAAIRAELEGVAKKLAALEAEDPEIATPAADPLENRPELEPESLKVVEAAIRALERRLADLRAQLAEEPEWLSAAGQEPHRNETHAELAQSAIRADSELTELRLKHQANLDALRKRDDQRRAHSRLRSEWTALRAEQDLMQQQLRDAEQQELAALRDVLARGAGQAVIVDVLDPPTYPLEPDVPNQLVIAFLGLVLGLGVGTCAVLTLDFLDKSVRTPAEVEQLLQLPVLGIISRIETPAEKRRARRRVRAATVGIVALFFLTALALFVQASSDGDVGALMARVHRILG